MCEVQPVEHLPQVRMINPHALQGGVELVVTLSLLRASSEPPPWLDSRVRSYGLLLSFPLP
jgi:hypothetical protein